MTVLVYNLALILFCLLFLALAYFFAFAESSTIAAQKVLLHHIGNEGDPRARIVEKFRDNPRRFFGVTLIGTNICIISLSAVGAHTMLPNWGIPVVFATILVDIVILVVSEITPKTLSLANPTLSSMKIAKPLEIASRTMTPLIWLITWLPSRVLNIDKIFHATDEDLITEDQIVHMIGLSAEQGLIDSTESERAVKVFQFGDTTVEKVMTPRADIVNLVPGDPLRKALHAINSTGFSRIPVITPDSDDSPGFLAAKDILRQQSTGELDETVDNYLRKVRFIPEGKKILSLLGEFRTSGEQIALVVNEFGTITGLVTLEDLLEEILGEIYDEYDRDVPAAQWVLGNLVLSGGYSADDLAERLKIELPEGDYDTAAGLILHLLDRVPRPGESVTIDSWTLIATHVVHQRITRIMARKKIEPSDEPDHDLKADSS